MKVGAVYLSLLLAASCARSPQLPTVGSDQYRSLCASFYLGLAALQSGEDVNARKGLTEAARIAPDEPASWLNLGLLQFRQQDFEGAFTSVSKAVALVPQNSRVEALLGIIESRRGHQPEALSHLKRAVELDGHNLKAAYALAQETERQSSPASDAQAQQLFEHILSVQPNNLAVLIDNIRIAAKRNDAARVRTAVARLQSQSDVLPDTARQQVAALTNQSQAADVRPAAVSIQFLKNVLVRAPAYRQSLDEVRTPATSAGEPFLRFFKLPSPRSEPDESDTQLTYQTSPVASGAEWAGAVLLDNDSKALPTWAAAGKLHLGDSTTLSLPGSAPFGPHSLATADLNYDFANDLILATQSGLRIYLQSGPGKFDEVHSLPSAITGASYTGVWAFDIDLDGDLDLVMGAANGLPTVLRNNGDGTFRPLHPFPGVSGLREFASADVDGDGDPDVALVDGSGHLQVFRNERLGDYRPRPVPASFVNLAEIVSGDVNGDGLPDFVALTQDGHVLRLSDVGAGKAWASAELVKAGNGPGALLLADLDNNGALDILANGQAFLGNGHTWTPVASPGLATTAVDLNDDGVLDLVGLSGAAATTWIGTSPRHYGWQTIRPRAARTSGDQRMNSFGIGGEIELRADLLTEKQIITEPRMHFGMGSHNSGIQFARIGWPNGLIQTEFGLKRDGNLFAEQRLKGSCPYLYAWNGHEMAFLKDVAPMSGALGAHNPDGTPAQVNQTEQWFQIPASSLQPSGGVYQLRITDEYWETYYVDRYRLLAFDHPAGTHLFIDERVTVPAAPLKPYLTREPQAFAAARDHRGRDVLSVIRAEDGRYLNGFRPAVYRGVVEPHFFEVTLPDTAPLSGPLYLVGKGWLHPWDDSTLIALNQGSTPKPQDLMLEVSEGNGPWHRVPGSFGVPAGRNKTVVLPLTHLFHSGHNRKLRLSTNLEIYWDQLTWAEGVTAEPKEHILRLQRAELQHHGFSAVSQNSASSPELPLYNQVVETGERWPALEGFYTRYGDIKPLLEASDDRYVLATSGDELSLEFTQLAKPDAGQVRDFVLDGDGWIKEGDYGFRGSQSVLPLPSHSRSAYSPEHGKLEQDPVYQAHQQDWQIYHTRFLGADHFWSKLWQ